MSFYTDINNQTTKKIYNILDDLEQKLSNRSNSRKTYRTYINRNYSNYNLDINDNYNNYYQRPQAINDTYDYRNTNNSQAIPPNIDMNKSSDLDIRKIIKDEVSSLIMPYQKDISILQDKMNEFSISSQKEDIKLRNAPINDVNKDNLLIEVKNMLLDYITIAQYNSKNEELENNIKNDINNLNVNRNTIQKLEDKFNNEIKKINQSIQDIKLKQQDLNNKLNNFTNNYNNEIISLKQNNNKILKQKYLMITKMISFLLVPVITFSAGHAIGKNSSNKINEYKTITRTINSNTGEIIGEQEEIFDEKETTYVATILEQKPWRQNPTGIGYIRNVTAYEYITPDNIDENYHVSVDDIQGNVIEKYKYIEQKDTLDENDNTNEITILITETYQDKNISRKSTKYIIPFSITGAILGIALDVALSLFNIFNYETAKRILDDLNTEINNNNLSEEKIKEKLLNLKNDIIILKKEYNDAVKKYGKLGNEFIFDDIDTTEITKFSKQLKRHF